MRRREFLKLGAAAAGGLALGAMPSSPAAAFRERNGETVLRGTVRLSGHTVRAGHTLRFDPSSDTTLELTRNLVVDGTLEMKPNRGVRHTIRFVGIDEADFVGGGMDVLDTDVGLWVIGDGRLDIEGTPRAGWNRTGRDPTWMATDQILTTPFAPGDTKTFSPYSGHLASVTGPDGRVFTQEAFNLTRSVRIEGTPTGRSHVIIRSTAPQNIQYAAFRYMGPRTPVGGQAISTAVLGRYGLHFHMCSDGSRGSVVRGVVVRDCGNHAFVPHMSDGITFRDCIAYNVNENAYFWDAGDPTNDTLWDHCMAAGLVPIPSFRGYTLAGFVLGMGRGTNCGTPWPQATSRTREPRGSSGRRRTTMAAPGRSTTASPTTTRRPGSSPGRTRERRT